MAAFLATAHQPSFEQPPDADGRMSFLEHLEELRIRIIRSCIAIAIGMAVAFVFIEPLFRFVFAPARRELPAGSTLIYIVPNEGFALYVKIALIAGTVIAAPYVAYQAWLFLAPALYAREKRFVVPFVTLATLGCVAGAAFNHYVVFPFMLRFFAAFSSPELVFMPRIEDVFDLYVNTLLGMIVVFQLPMVMFFLARMGLVTAAFLWRNFKYSILISFIVAAIVTPTSDPWNQTLVAAPMILLYLVSIAIAWIVAPGRRPSSRRSRPPAD